MSNFSREIEIDSENTFLQLRNTILESVGYTKDELDSFFLCDDDWEKQEEVSLEEMAITSSDRDQWLMESTTISELIEDEGQRMIFQFDYEGDRGFFMELKEILPSRHLAEPLCTIKRGKAPEQFVEIDDVERRAADVKAAQTPDMDALDIESIGDESFDDEDIDSGFDIMNMD